MNRYGQFISPFGEILLAINQAQAITQLIFLDAAQDSAKAHQQHPNAKNRHQQITPSYHPKLNHQTQSVNGIRDDEAIQQIAEQINHFFSGQQTHFDLPLAPAGSDFQHKVWQALLTIPFGETRSYGEIARQIGSPKAARAVGLANRSNPIPLIIPCHRVIGADGSLTGYACGLALKQRLLNLEKTNATGSRISHHLQPLYLPQAAR